MHPTWRFLFCLALALGLSTARSAGSPALEWRAGPTEFLGEDRSQAVIRFSLRNPDSQPLTITAVEPTCGCTVVETPSLPWELAARGTGEVRARVDLRGKQGTLHKSIRLGTSAGVVLLPVKLDVPSAPVDEARLNNQLVALADARAIFRGDCARCHAAPAVGRQGAELFRHACAICHEAHPRAGSVPALDRLSHQTADSLRRVVAEGRPGSMMPPFAKEAGGILDPAQVDSLVAYLLPRHSAPAAQP